ncbi:transketolase-like TK C-terminal-containing protein [Mycolicibacterium agri]|nr:transketolase C-terminal domain-containing protein [Mycolicibacterium agri]
MLTRQGAGVEGTSAEVWLGGYVLGGGNPADDADVIIIATGSELQLAVQAKKVLADKEITAYVVSMPCVEWFESQPGNRDAVLPQLSGLWRSRRRSRRAGTSSSATPAKSCPSSTTAPADDKTLFREYGFTPEAVVAAARSIDK